VKISRFKVERRLGAGGMGEAFLVRDEQGRQLVLKRVLPYLASDPAFRDLFFAEAGAAARLVHPHIAQVFELGEDAGRPFLVMEYVPGLDVGQLSEGRPLPLGAACRLVVDAAAALHCAHTARDAQGRPLHLVHRDVSPHNLLVRTDGVVKLIDFGVARATAGQVGKLAWASPEQVLERQLDARSDQFSLGVVWWEALAGQPLFDAETDAETMDRVVACDVPEPCALPAAVEVVLRTMLSQDPAQRFADLGAARQALLETGVVGSHADVAALQAVELRGAGSTPLGVNAGSILLRAKGSSTTLVLSPHETVAFAQLVALTSPFTIEDAEAALDLWAFPDAPWALDVVQALVEKGALSSVTLADGTLAFTVRR
jgi:serine/threonine protein kinase